MGVSAPAAGTLDRGNVLDGRAFRLAIEIGRFSGPDDDRISFVVPKLLAGIGWKRELARYGLSLGDAGFHDSVPGVRARLGRGFSAARLGGGGLPAVQNLRHAAIAGRNALSVARFFDAGGARMQRHSFEPGVVY